MKAASLAIPPHKLLYPLLLILVGTNGRTNGGKELWIPLAILARSLEPTRAIPAMLSVRRHENELSQPARDTCLRRRRPRRRRRRRRRIASFAQSQTLFTVGLLLVATREAALKATHTTKIARFIHSRPFLRMYVFQSLALRSQHHPHEFVCGEHLSQPRLDHLVLRRRLLHRRVGGQWTRPDRIKRLVFTYVHRQSIFSEP